MVRDGSFIIQTSKRIEVVNITPQVRDFVRSTGIGTGLCSVNVRHTSAGIMIQEDERLLKEDFENYFRPIVEDDRQNPRYRHNCLWERPQCDASEPLNAGAHISSALVGSSVSVPVRDGDLNLGTWQQVLLLEYDGPRRREVIMTVEGEAKKPQIEQYLDEIKPLIVERMKSTLPFSDDEYPDIAQDIRRGLEGGKHLRGGLCVLISDALGGDRDRALSYAAWIDAVHYATLVHDDVIDADVERRGAPTFWAKYGRRKAVIIGDRLFALVKKRFLELGHKEAAIYASTLDTITGGVAQEINLAEFGIDLVMGRVHRNLYPKIIKAKTASLFKAAARLGAVAAGVKEEQEEKLARYGELIGFSFQVADDLCDLALVQRAKRPQPDKLASIILMGIHYDSVSFKNLFKPLIRGEGMLNVISRSKLEERAVKDIKAKIKEANGYIKGMRMRKPYCDYLRGYGEYAVGAILAEANLSLG